MKDDRGDENSIKQSRPKIDIIRGKIIIFGQEGKSEKGEKDSKETNEDGENEENREDGKVVDLDKAKDTEVIVIDEDGKIDDIEVFGNKVDVDDCFIVFRDLLVHCYVTIIDMI